MPRKKKEIEIVKETLKTKRSSKKYPKDDGPLTDSQIAQIKESVGPIPQFEIDWDKIAADVKEAALMLEQSNQSEKTSKRKKTA